MRVFPSPEQLLIIKHGGQCRRKEDGCLSLIEAAGQEFRRICAELFDCDIPFGKSQKSSVTAVV